MRVVTQGQYIEARGESASTVRVAAVAEDNHLGEAPGKCLVLLFLFLLTEPSMCYREHRSSYASS